MFFYVSQFVSSDYWEYLLTQIFPDLLAANFLMIYQ